MRTFRKSYLSVALLLTGIGSLSNAIGAPVALGPTVNSLDVDVAPSLSADGLGLYFHSTRPGPRSFDIRYTARPDLLSAWAAPVTLGTTLNSAAGDVGPDIAFDGSTLYFASDRDVNSRDLYAATLVPLPAAAWLFGSGVLALAGFGSRTRAGQSRQT